MKKNKLIVSAMILGIAALTMTSCSKAPQEKIDSANLAVQEVQAAEAEIYATENFIALQDSLKAALESVEAQKSSFIKNYAEAEAKLDYVATYAAEVKVEAQTAKEAFKNEIAMNIAEIKSLLEENKQLINDAPKGKEGTTALMAIKGELDIIQSSVTESDSLLAQGQLVASSEKVKATKEKAMAINAELKDVIAKYKAVGKRA